MELYYFNACPFCQRVLRAIDRLDIRDQIIFKDTRASAENRKELIDLCGNTQVPTLTVDGKPMRESADIVAFLDQKFAS